MDYVIKRIIFFIEVPFYKRDFSGYGIEILKNSGFEVEVWNFTPFLKPRLYKEVNVPEPFYYEKYFLFQLKKDALKQISRLSRSDLIVCTIWYTPDSYAIYRAISKKQIPYCFLYADLLPWLGENRNVNKDRKIALRTILSKIKRINSVKLKDFIFRLPYTYNIGVNPVNFILGGGEKTILYKRKIDARAKIFWLHSFDYDIYLKDKDRAVQVDMNTGVFLDVYVPFHPDLIFLGVDSPCTPEEYYPKICNFFDFLENNYGVRIVIAAHPRSHYERHPDYFGKRPIMRNKTMELVQKSGFVITNFSTSINFVVLCKKPVIFITTNKLQASTDGTLIERMASLLKKKVINLDQDYQIDLRKEMCVDEIAYDTYKNDYIKKVGTQDLPFWQIFANLICSGNNLLVK